MAIDRSIPSSSFSFLSLNPDLALPFSQKKKKKGTSACPNGVFYCANLGSVPKLLNASAVDDSVCDCCDGSDEQQQGAASRPKSSSSSPASSPSSSSAAAAAARCPNTCAAEGAAVAAAAKAAADAAAAGAAARERAVAKARRERASWSRSLSRLDSDLSKAQEAVESLREAKEAAEKEDELEREEKRRAEEEEEEKKRKEEAAEAAAATEGAGGAEKPAEAPEVAAAAASAPAAAPEAPKEAAEKAATEEEDPEEAGRRIASQWTHDPEAASASSSDPDPPGPDAPPPDAEHHSLHRHSERQLTLASAAVAGVRSAVERLVEFLAAAAAKAKAAAAGKGSADASSASSSSPPPQKHPETPRERAKRAFREAEAAARELTEKRLRVEAKAKLDFGPDAAFASLLGECASVEVDKYNYNVCFFEGASQSDRGGGGGGGGGHSTTTLLGTWAGWGAEVPEIAPLPGETPDGRGEKVTESEEDALKRAMLSTKEGPDGALPERFYRTMRFAEGQQCWNGPPRSLTLAVTCGKETKLSKVSEPSRCEYEASLETPAACDEEAVRDAAEGAERALAAARGVGVGGKDLRDEL